jgi:hypothetical protein
MAGNADECCKGQQQWLGMFLNAAEGQQQWLGMFLNAAEVSSNGLEC